MKLGPGEALLVVALVGGLGAAVFVGIGFIAGRREATDVGRHYLYLVSLVSLAVAVFGAVLALWGVVQVGLPGTVAGADREPRLIAPPPDRDDALAERLRRADPFRFRDEDVRRPPVVAKEDGARAVRSRGVLGLLRGLILFVVGGAVYAYHWRRIPRPPAPPAAPVEPAPEPDSQ